MDITLTGSGSARYQGFLSGLCRTVILTNILLINVVTFSAAQARPDLRKIEFVPTPLVAATQPSTRIQRGGENQDFLSIDPYLPVSYQSTTPVDVDLGSAIAEHRARIENTIHAEGPFSQALIADLDSLARLYQDNGEHGRALDTFDEAIHISKINQGLFHPDQIPLIEGSVQSLVSQGRVGEVDKQLDYLIYMHQKHYGQDSLEMIRPLAAKVAWDMYLFEQQMLPGNNDQSAFVSGYSGLPNAGPVKQGVLIKTQELIIRGIHILVNASEFANPFLHKFEQQLIETYFYQAHHDEQTRATSHYVSSLEGSYITAGPFDFTKANYQNGVQAYERILSYLERSHQEGTLEYVVATVGLADWYLLFDELEKSRDQYGLAAELLDAGDFSEAQKQTLLQPSIPVELPAFGQAPLFSALRDTSGVVHKPEDYRGYVDVSFELNRMGRALDVKILSRSEGTPNYIASELEWKIRDSRYRPLVNDVVLQDREALALRYYYNY